MLKAHVKAYSSIALSATYPTNSWHSLISSTSQSGIDIFPSDQLKILFFQFYRPVDGLHGLTVRPLHLIGFHKRD